LFCVQAHKKKHGNRTLEQILEDLRIAKSNGCTGVVLTGGEVTIREDILEIVVLAKKLCFKVIQIQTNGRKFIDKDLCKKAIGCGVNQFSISIHGHNSELHDALTRSKKSFDQTITAIKNLKELNQLVLTNTVIVKQNYKYAPNIANLLVNLRIDQFQMAFVHPLGNAFNFFNKIVPRISAVSQYIKTALQIGINSNIKVMVEAIPYCLIHGYERYSAELIAPETELRDIDRVILDFKKTKRDKLKTKFDQCLNCKFDFLCEGTWKEYPERLGSKEFKAIEGRKIKSVTAFYKEFGQNNRSTNT